MPVIHGIVPSRRGEGGLWSYRGGGGGTLDLMGASFDRERGGGGGELCRTPRSSTPDTFVMLLV